MSASPTRTEHYPERLLDRHLRDLRFAEVTRALRALSAGYVEKREEGGLDRALDGRGKRSAFALYYGALHFAATRSIIADTGLGFDPGPGADRGARAARVILDLGCGTGVCGAAWAVESAASVRVMGVDRAGFALQEAVWTYAALGIEGKTSRDLAAALAGPRPDGLVLGWALNEFEPGLRERVTEAALAWVERGTRLLVIEPVSRRVAPWWDTWVAAWPQGSLRVSEVRVRPVLHPKIALLARSAGLSTAVLPLKIAVSALLKDRPAGGP